MKNLSLALIIVAFLSACASVKVAPSVSYTPQSDTKLSLDIQLSDGVAIASEYLTMLEENIKGGLAASGLLENDQEAANQSVTVTVSDFRMRDDAARLTVGILAGCDKIMSTIVVTDNTSGDELGRTEAKIRECAAWGVAAQVIEKYTDGVVSFLTESQ